MKKINDEEEEKKQKEERRQAYAAKKNPKPKDLGEEKAKQFEEEVANEKFEEEQKEEKEKAQAEAKKNEDKQETAVNQAKRIPGNCELRDGECWTSNMPEKYLRLQMGQNNLRMA